MTDLFELAVAIYRMLEDPKENWISGKAEVKGTRLLFQAYRVIEPQAGPGVVIRVDVEKA